MLPLVMGAVHKESVTVQRIPDSHHFPNVSYKHVRSCSVNPVTYGLDGIRKN
jgi:hypothetical protein